jgi:hypothetical protein
VHAGSWLVASVPPLIMDGRGDTKSKPSHAWARDVGGEAVEVRHGDERVLRLVKELTRVFSSQATTLSTIVTKRYCLLHPANAIVVSHMSQNRPDGDCCP